VQDPVVALALDDALALRLVGAEQRAADAHSGKGTIPADQRYESLGEAYAAGQVN